MEELQFLSGDLPSGYQPGFEISLYNLERHRLLQSPAGWKSFYALSPKNRRIEAAIFFYMHEQRASSPWRAPFGSVECNEKISPEALFRFLEFVEAQLVALGVKNISIRNSPQAYAPVQHALIETFLFNLGYQVSAAEVGAVVPVGNDPLRLDNWEKRKLRQSREARLVFRELTSDHLDDVYFFILACRKRKNYSLSMTLAELRETVNAFRERFLLFGVFQDDKIVAASIAVRVTNQVLYNFYSDHDNQFDHVSPVVFLIEGIYQFCARQYISLLDLGTSALAGKPNFGLLDFKMRLQGQPTTKLTFHKVIGG